MIDNFNQNLKTSNTMVQVNKLALGQIDGSYTSIARKSLRCQTFKKNFLFKISTIRTKKFTDIRYNAFSSASLQIALRCCTNLSSPRSEFNI